METSSDRAGMQVKVAEIQIKLDAYLQEGSLFEEGEDLTSLQDLVQAECGGEDPKVTRRLLSEFCGWGPLEGLIEDESISEILINQAAEVVIERKGQLEAAPDSFLSVNTYRSFIDRFCMELGISLSFEQPFIDSSWQNFRVHLVGPPLAPAGPLLSLRRHPRNAWSLTKLAEKGWAPAEAVEMLRRDVQEKRNILVVGPTGSGKTSVLNACLNELGQNERAITIEDCAELIKPNQFSCQLISHPNKQEFDTCSLLRQALRMRPDRLIMGEVRGAEAKDLLQALSTGHQGSMGSLHASGPRQALQRLEMLVQMGAPKWSTPMIRSLIFFGIDRIVVCRRHQGHRDLEGIYALSSLEDTGALIETLYSASKS